MIFNIIILKWLENIKKIKKIKFLKKLLKNKNKLDIIIEPHFLAM